MILLIFIAGAFLGSFGSVLLSRLAEKISRIRIRSILIGRSQCPHCKTTLKPLQLIPIISYLRQGGKCTHCHKKISPFYLVLEIVSGLVIALTYLRLQHTGFSRGALSFRGITNFLLLLLALHDIQTRELHDAIRYLLLARILGWTIWSSTTNRLFTIQTTIITLGIFWIIYRWAKRYANKRYQMAEGFGLWDVYLGGIIAILLPSLITINHLPETIMTNAQLVILLFLIASILGIIGYLLSHKKSSSPLIPFFPSLILSFRIVLTIAPILLHFAFS